MGRQIIENLPRTKLIYNQYTLNSNTSRAHNLIYTVPTGKKAVVNFKYASVGKVNNGTIYTYSIQLAAQKYASSPRLHSIIAVGRYYLNSTANDGQMITLASPHDYMEGSPNSAYNGNSSHHWWGINQGMFMQNAYLASDNSPNGGSSNDAFSAADYTSSATPWGGNNNSGNVNARKDFIMEAGEELYFFYRVQNYSNYQSGQRTDVMVEVKEIESFA
tara:strand:- start:3 stop:656 length:654 start_codon:yes stop_codon:yes gene_type:complete